MRTFRAQLQAGTNRVTVLNRISANSLKFAIVCSWVGPARLAGVRRVPCCVQLVLVSLLLRRSFLTMRNFDHSAVLPVDQACPFVSACDKEKMVSFAAVLQVRHAPSARKPTFKLHRRE